MADKNDIISTNITSKDKYDFNTQGTALPDLNNKSDAEVTSAMWGLQPALIQEISNMNRVYASKHGMFASVPIICRGQDCAYKDVCMISKQQRIVGQRCPMEIAAILSRYEQWCMHFEIDTTQNMIHPEDLVDATLIKDLVNIEVQMMRAENKIALNGDFMATTLADIDKKCNPYYESIVSPEVEFLQTLQNSKIKILNQLNATRKDKASDKGKANGSETAIKIFQQVQDMIRGQNTNINITELEFDDTGEVIEATEIQNLVDGGETNGNSEESPERDRESGKSGLDGPI